MKYPTNLSLDLNSFFEISVFQPSNLMMSPDRSLGLYDYEPNLDFKPSLDSVT
jgi:hypothetical protein